jgi:hypothetical protein
LKISRTILIAIFVATIVSNEAAVVNRDPNEKSTTMEPTTVTDNVSEPTTFEAEMNENAEIEAKIIKQDKLQSDVNVTAASTVQQNSTSTVNSAPLEHESQKLKSDKNATAMCEEYAVTDNQVNEGTTIDEIIVQKLQNQVTIAVEITEKPKLEKNVATPKSQKMQDDSATERDDPADGAKGGAGIMKQMHLLSVAVIALLTFKFK